MLLLLAVCAIPFALAQSLSRGTTKPNVLKPTVVPNLTALSPTISKTHAIRPNPDFAPPGVIEKQLSGLRTDGAVGPPTGTPGGCQFHVLIVYADTVGAPSQLQSEIKAEPNVISVDVFDATSGTPTLAQLQQYQIVVPLGSNPFLDGDTLGNNLADYVDGGGIVVQYGFSFYGPGQPFGINGRWVSGNYNPYNYSINVESNAFTLGPHNAGHPLMAGVTTLNSNYANIVTLASGATEVAQNSLGLGESLVAYRPVSGGHTTVGVTAYVGANAAQSGDWGKVIVNAGNWLANCQGGSPTPTATASPTPSPTPTGTPGCTPVWLNERPMANARRNAAVAVSSIHLYAITGFNGAPDYTAVTEHFLGSSWVTEAPIPVPHAQSRGTAVGQFIYVPGGFNSVSFGGPLDTMQIYETGFRTWSSGASMPGTRSGVATATFSGMVYIIAGYTTPFPTVTNTVFIYNPGTNSYTMGAPMPVGQGNVAGVLFNGEIYVVGGGTAPGAQYAYNPTTNTWRTIAVMPTTGGTCESDGGFVLNNELWVVGCLGLPINQQVWIYNPGSDSWRAGPQYNVDHQGPGAALFNGRGFVVGGGAASGGSTAVELVSCGATPTPTATCSICLSPTPTSTPTATATAPATATPTATAIATATATPTVTATATHTPTATPTASATATYTPTPTATPTATPTSTPTPTPHPAFFTGEIALGGGWYYLQFPNGTPFGYYSYLSDQNFIYHIDLGFEYLFDANDASHGIYFYDFASSSFLYTSPTLFPYLYDFSLNAWLYYLPDANNPGRYTHNPRWFYNFATGQWITL